MARDFMSIAPRQTDISLGKLARSRGICNRQKMKCVPSRQGRAFPEGEQLSAYGTAAGQAGLGWLIGILPPAFAIPGTIRN
jgi:hypothetical protein